MNQFEPSNIAMPLHLFKMKGDSHSYIIGSIFLSYIDSVRILNPLWINNYSEDPELLSCNGAVRMDNLEFSISIKECDILYQIQQDFIPKELVKDYRIYWNWKSKNYSG